MWVAFAVVLSSGLVHAQELTGVKPDWVVTTAIGALPPLNPHAPKLSDVVFSTREKRDDSIRMMKAFNATRCEWIYSNDKAFIAEVKRTCGHFGATINANPKLPSDEGYARDLEGKPLVAPWMKRWGAKWAATTYSVTREAQLAAARRAIDAGADSIQHDDPALQAASIRFGGDFSDATIAGFRDYLAKHTTAEQRAKWGIEDLASFDYRAYLAEKHGIRTTKEYIDQSAKLPTTRIWMEYLRSTVREYFAELRTLLNTYQGRRTPLSMNIPSPEPAMARLFLTDFADYVMSELTYPPPEGDAVAAATARAVGLGFVPSIHPKTVRHIRARIAQLYALGGQPIVPWDVYMPDVKGQAQQRFFGRLEDMGDLYRFVRQNGQLFDGMEATPVVAIAVPVDRYRHKETFALVRKLLDANVPFGFVLSGGSGPTFSLDPERLNRFRAVVSVNPLTDFSERDRKFLSARGVSVVDPSKAPSFDALAPIAVSGNGDAARIFTRVATKSKTRLVVHVVADAEGEERGVPERIEGITLALTAASRLTPKTPTATWYEPGVEGGRKISVTAGGEGGRMALPPLRDWGIVVLDF